MNLLDSSWGEGWDAVRRLEEEKKRDKLEVYLASSFPSSLLYIQVYLFHHMHFQKI